MGAGHAHDASGHRRHLALTALVGVGLVVYLTGLLPAIYDFDLALLLTLVGGFPIFSQAVIGLAKRRISADLAAEPGTTAYYYVRGEQADGELVWVSPMWITYQP